MIDKKNNYMKKITYTLLLILSIQLQAMEKDTRPEEDEAALVLASFNLINEPSKVQTDLANPRRTDAEPHVKRPIEDIVKRINIILENASKNKKVGLAGRPTIAINKILREENVNNEQIATMTFSGKNLITSISNITGYKNYILSDGQIITNEKIKKRKSKNPTILLQKCIVDLLNTHERHKKASLPILKKITNSNIEINELSKMTFVSHGRKFSFYRALQALNAQNALKIFTIKNGKLSYNEKGVKARKARLEYEKKYNVENRRRTRKI
jgi:hypothetical protein